MKSLIASGTQTIGPEISWKKIRHVVAIGKSKAGCMSNPIYAVKQTAGIIYGKK